MSFLKQFYFKTLNYDLYNKFKYTNTKQLPKLKKIILNFGCKTTELKYLSASLLALELITKQKGQLTLTKHVNIFLKFRKGNPIGCKIVLKKKRMLIFLENNLIDILPKIKNFNNLIIPKKIKKNIFSYELHNTFNFTELEEHYYLFIYLPKLQITLVTNTIKKEELLFLLKSLQLPLHK